MVNPLTTTNDLGMVFLSFQAIMLVQPPYSVWARV
jgi:hypothetical protein